MDQDVAIMGDLMAIMEDLITTTEVLVATMVDLVATMGASIMETMEASIMGTMGASIMEAVFPTADMDRIVILATTANTTTVSSLEPWPVSSMEGRHQGRRIV